MLKDILSISGHSGLFKYLKKSRNGIIVENLETKKRMNADATAQINALEDISIYTDTEDLPLDKVFKAIYEHEDGKATMNPKKVSGKELRKYFEKIVPDHDQERVYSSDIKKILTWYNVLHKLDMLNFEEEEEKEEEQEQKESQSTEQEEKKEENKDEENKTGE
jgi:hypothetical protein